jgi:RimJ/RimL family protein N-acetyltransferase
MQEAADAVTDFWFNELKFPVLRAPKAVANTASRHISEKQRMRLVATEERNFVCGRMPAEIGRSRRKSGTKNGKKGRNVLA